MAEVKRTEESLDESERGEWKSGIKLNIQKTKIMASSPISSRQTDGETMETVRDFIFLGSKITADGELLLGRKVMTNLEGVLKSRDITLPTKVCLVKDMVFPVVLYGYVSQTIKKAECQWIDAFQLWCLERLESLLDSKEVKSVNPKGN